MVTAVEFNTAGAGTVVRVAAPGGEEGGGGGGGISIAVLNVFIRNESSGLELVEK